ncbi:hypothetical protein BDW59DRAFT_181214 [Aspergillus cavernicola]|uniref:Tc toxin complex TcA C-terminal TcB-binding domain-containing protein n=1 Tax=Aspergillus cavernicola TaxID=176166 RepID=A0ABR4I129_9EURO
MSTPAPQPSSPTEWLEYARGQVVSSIPLRQEEKTEQNTAIHRDIYLDESAIIKQSKLLLYVYTDVLALSKLDTTISPPAYGLIQVQTRVLTAATPVNLNIVPDSKGCQLWIFASLLNQPVTVSTNGSEPVSLHLGPGTGNVGVYLTILPGQIDVKYQKSYNPVPDPNIQANLETQLQIALALFWRKTSIAVSLCSYIAEVTTNPPLYPQLNTQAVALGQQLAAQVMTGPDMGYAPVLNIQNYKETVRDALNAVAAFEQQYTRFQDKKQSLEDQLKTWDTMIQQATTQLQIHKYLKISALEKYTDAQTIVTRCVQQLIADNTEINSASNAFRQGLENSALEQWFQAALDITTGILKFASGVGALSLADLSKIVDAITNITNAVKAIKTAEGLPNQKEKKVSSTTVKSLGDCMQALESLYPTTDTMVEAIKNLESDPTAPIPTSGDISGSSEGDSNARAILTLAAWDKWTLESDQQLQFAVTKGIGGAGAYQLALQKHGISGKALAQAQAEAIKAGHEYIQAEMEYIGCNKDIADLKKLRSHYQGEEKIYAKAEAKFFGRFQAIRNSLAIEMRKLVWAYKYWALADSAVELDSQKSAAEFGADLVTLATEIESAHEKYATDFQPFKYTVHSTKLPSNYGQLMIDGLKGETHSASFTLAPDDSGGQSGFASVFTDGAHFRLDGLETFLSGALPQEQALHDDIVQVDIQIFTSGVYADIMDGKLSHFTSIPRSVRLSYDLHKSGHRGTTHVHATYPTKDHAEPTPFTQWTIKLLHPEKLDLSGLTRVDLEWAGHARFPDNASRVLSIS